MLPMYRKHALIGILSGFVLLVIGQFARYEKEPIEVLAPPGLLGVIGLIILALMPDGHKRSDGAKFQPEGQPASADSSACPEAVAGDQDSAP